MFEQLDTRFCDDSGEGDRGDFDEGLGDLVKSRNFDGDLESDRLSERTADETST